jgi:thiamine biosynthesis lipoprotein
MGNRFELTVVHRDPQFADECLLDAIAEISRIENLLTTFKEDSQTNQINAFAGIKPMPADPEVIALIQRAQKIAELTQGAFDLSYGSIDKRFWNFDTKMTALPDRETARQSIRLINYRNILVDEKAGTVFLKEKGMRIGFGGIGKGYAADRARVFLKQKGIQSGVVNAAGDLTAWGYHPEGKPWTIGIADPGSKHQPFSQLSVTDKAVATSGDYEKFVMIDGKRYAHTIDPKTGFPVSGIKSVTVIAPSAELADALATPVMVMGVKTGLHLLNQMKNLACIIIDAQDRIHTTSNIKINQYE